MRFMRGLASPASTASAAFQARYGLQAVSFGNQLWVIGGNTGALTLPNDVWSSSNGQTWSQVSAAAAFPGRFDHAAAAFNGRMWVIAADGVSWVQATGSAPFTPRTQHQA